MSLSFSFRLNTFGPLVVSVTSRVANVPIYNPPTLTAGSGLLLYKNLPPPMNAAKVIGLLPVVLVFLNPITVNTNKMVLPKTV